MRSLCYVILLWLPINLFSQHIPPAGFGLDGDLYTDPVSAGEMIDWFSQGSNKKGALDISVGDSIHRVLQAMNHVQGRNFEFSFDGATQHSSLLIDVLYQRDQISAGSARDTSTFITGASKNADHPDSWNIGLPGSPQKGDLVDVFSLLMRDQQAITGDLWFIGGVSTRTATGNKHIDFEFYREDLHFHGGQMSSSGKDGGRTAWLFDMNGKVIQAGDFIISIDFVNGGTMLESSIRIWLNPSTFPAGDLTTLNDQLPFKLNGTFDQGTNSGSFGYAEIVLPSTSSALIIKANDDSSTMAAPWGTLSGPRAVLAQSYLPMQWMEVAVNLSELGLDPSDYQGLACRAPLGNVLVKSRASQSFTAELKDFVRPMPFGDVNEWELNVESDDLNCIRQEVLPHVEPQHTFLEYSWEGPQSFSSNQILPQLTMPGTYFLTVGPPQGCVLRDTLTVNIDTVKPDLQLTGGVINCIQTSVNLQAFSSPTEASFTWVGPNGNSFSGSNWTVSEAGWYHATAMHPRSGCTMTDSIEIVLDTLTPNVQLQTIHLSCLNPSAHLVPTISPEGNYQYQWLGPDGYSSQEQRPLIHKAGTYSLALRVPTNGCEVETSVDVTEDFNAPVVQIENDTLDCLETLVQLSGIIQPINGVAVVWSGPNGFNSTDPFPWVGESGTYQITVTHTENACSTSQEVYVESVRVFEDMQITGGEISCTQEFVQLSSGISGAGYTYLWTGLNGFSSTSEEPAVNQAGMYYLTINHTATGCESMDSVYVTSNRIVPQIDIEDSVMLNCHMSNWRPTLPSTYQYVWTSNHGFSSTNNNPIINEGGTYTMVVTDPTSGCDTTMTIIVEEDFTRPVVNLSGDPLTCIAPTTELAFEVSNTDNYTFYWLGPNGFFSRIENPEIYTAGTYRLYVRNTENGCLSISSITIVDQNKPISVTAIGGTLNCQTDSLQLAYTADIGNYEMTWTGPGGFTSDEPSPWVQTGGNYQIQLIDQMSGCSGTSVVQIREDYSPPVFTLRKNSDLNCQYQQVRLSAYSRTNYSFSWWVNGDSIASGIHAYVSETGTYTVKATNRTNGCEAEQTIIVEENLEVPTATITRSDTLSCTNRFVQLQLDNLGEGTYHYYWSGPNGFTSTQMEPWVSKSGTYSLKLTHTQSRCDTTLSFTVEGDPTPLSVQLIGGMLTCNEPNVQIQVIYDGNGDLVYSWTGPLGFMSTKPSPIVTEAGNYQLAVSDTLTGCRYSTSITIQGDTEISYLRAGSGTLGCPGSTTRLTAQYSLGTYHFSWTGPLGFGSTDRSPAITQEGTYTLTLIDQESGCTATDSVRVNRLVIIPSLSLQSSGELNCNQDSVKLYPITSSGNYTYTWDGPSGFMSEQVYPFVNEEGLYFLTLKDLSSQCQAIDSIRIAADRNVPTLGVTDTSLNCESPHISLGAHLPDTLQYSWTGPHGFSALGKPISIDEAGVYELVVRNPANGCEAVEIIEVAEAPPCTDALCTQTQGFYGNDNGRFCDGRNTRNVLLDLLKTDLVIGGGKNQFTLSAEELDAFFLRMPGGGNSIPLDGVATSVNPVGIPLDNKGQFDNNLLAQTITLGLNLRLSPGLARVGLENTVVTSASSDCQQEDAIPVNGSERSFRIPSVIISYIGDLTVESLYVLANEALAGTYIPQEGRPSYGEITGAIGMINDGFNGCRILREFSSDSMTEIAWTVNSYPNPTMGDPVSFGFEALESGEASLDLRNMVTGGMVSLPYYQNVLEGETYTIDIPVKELPEGTYFYLLRLNGEIVAQGSIRVYQ